MRFDPRDTNTDPSVLRELIRENPWAIFVSHGPDGMTASHYPLLLADDSDDDIVVVTHAGRPDPTFEQVTSTEVLVIVQGRHGYISPSWYPAGATPAPTWNFATAHCHGVPEVLDEEENVATLARLVEHFEQHLDHPVLLDPSWARSAARGTIGVRIRISRFVCKVKMSQDKDSDTRQRVVEALRAPGPYHNALLADDLLRANSGGRSRR